METNRNRLVRQQRRRVFGNGGIRVVYAKSEIGYTIGCPFAVFAFGLAGGKFVRAKNVLGPKIARADTIRTAEYSGGFVLAQRRQISAVLQRFVRFAERHADIPSQRVIASHPFISSFEDNDILFSAQGVDDRGFRKW